MMRAKKAKKFVQRLQGAQMITDFECSINAVRATASYLRGHGHGAMSTGPSSRVLGKLGSLPPSRVRAEAFRMAARPQGLPLEQAREIDVDLIDTWVTQQYGPGPYPAVLIGAPNGAAFHLSAALGVPFLPQTTLVSVKDTGTHEDDPVQAMEALAPTAQLIAQNNPRVKVYHMHDPAQDRPMMQQLAFMRLKRLSLGPVYEKFLRERLAPGATIIQLENTRDWRTTSTGERTVFQFGCLGGVPEEEFHNSGERIKKFLEQENSSYRRWDPPQTDDRSPDGEWGWDPALDDSIARVAEESNLQRRRLVVNEPQDASGFIAELYRDWYRSMGWEDNRLLVQTYAHVDPAWTLNTGSVPLWNRFHASPEFDSVQAYLEQARPYEDVYISLFAHGLDSPGIVPIEDWEILAQRHATRQGKVIGVDHDAHPIDPGAVFRYQKAIKDIPARKPAPSPLTVSLIDEFYRRATTEQSGAIGHAQWLVP
ncbi:hypothetical protein [Nesterenkonia sandarakina]|uniref:Uncharacterized protein n=1 Tax=Nesterenkonia sandarakina TaxID=272918 RepID=A0A7Z0J287_9MICC|nr:hypothetical protein [Nesterenkonia sandarakina]NYJ15473.1 hypothetical protein [Nesterenkonia sandarakina]